MSMNLKVQGKLIKVQKTTTQLRNKLKAFSENIQWKMWSLRSRQAEEIFWRIN